jgi:hypothetical protein
MPASTRDPRRAAAHLLAVAVESARTIRQDPTTNLEAAQRPYRLRYLADEDQVSDVLLHPLNDRDGGNWEPGHVDREDASPIREIARIDPTIIRFSAASAVGETKTHVGSIGAALLERPKELVDIPTRQTAALVLDLDEHALGARANPERDGRPRPGELEGVLQKVSHDRGEDLSVGLDRPRLRPA